MAVEKFNINKIRKDFPILNTKVYNKPLIYLDNAATTQKPKAVIDKLVKYYENENANIHRGVHYLSQLSTLFFENTREKVKTFINATHAHEIIFTKGTTESINLVASSFSESFLDKDDEILITQMEHHSNIVPWQMACIKKNAHLRYIPFNDNGDLLLDDIDNLLSSKVKLLALTHISNALGTINPIKEIIQKAHQKNIPVLIDGAQAVAHLKVDVRELDCDFYCFSGHKIYAPMGIGVLYGKENWLNKLPPYQGGGEMIKTVSLDKGTTYNDLPFKFEAGTPNVSDVLGLDAAIDYISHLGLENIKNYENELLHYATEKLSDIEGIKIIGTSQNKASVLSFIVKNIHPYDIGTLLDKMGIALRTGHHCAQPVMDKYGINGTVRASFALYNTKEEVDILYEGIVRAFGMLR